MEPDDDGLFTCEWCEGKFVAEDMEGDHCSDCSSQIFDDESDGA